MPDHLEALEIFTALGSAKGYKTLVSHLLPGEPRDTPLFLTYLGPRLPGFLRKAAAWCAKTVMGDAAMARLIDVSSVKSVEEVFKWQGTRHDFVEKVRHRLWGDLALDATICKRCHFSNRPCCLLIPISAFRPGTSDCLCNPWSYRGSVTLGHSHYLLEAVDSSVGVILVTRVHRELDQLPSGWDEVCKKAASPWLSKKLYGGVYDADKMYGIPIGVQIVGPAWHEEKVREMMKALNDALEDAQGKQFGPGLAAEFKAAEAVHVE